MLALVGEDFLSPRAGYDLQVFLNHLGNVGQVGAVGHHLVGITGPANAQVNAAAGQHVQRRQAGRHVQRVVQRRQHHGDAQPHGGGALAQGRQGDVGGAGMGPFGTEVVFHEPDGGHAHLFGEADLLHHFLELAGFTAVIPGLGHLDLVEEAEVHTVTLLRLRAARIVAERGLEDGRHGGVVRPAHHERNAGMPGRRSGRTGRMIIRPYAFHRSS